MHFNKKLPKEVAEMETRMREFIESDPGAAQFVARYGETAASPAVRKQYHDWAMAELRERSILQGARSLGVEEGIEKGRKLRLEEDLEKVARVMLRNGLSVEMIMEATGLTMERINSLRE
jgi:predicted transposase/invertase (TIGR01784 family)